MHELVEICTKADSEGLLVVPPSSTLDGFSGSRLVGAIQRFTRHFSNSDNAVYPELSWDVLLRVEALVGQGADADAQRETVRRMLETHRAQYPGRHKHKNTYSASLPSFKVAMADPT